jgi:Electron transfer DM13
MLSVGIATNTAIFSVVNGVLLRALPYPRDDRILTAVGFIFSLPSKIVCNGHRPELLLVNRTVSEEFPPAPRSAAAESETPRQLLSGQFKGYAHPTEGTAVIYGIDSKRILRLTNFRTSHGPDVHVYLVAAPDAELTYDWSIRLITAGSLLAKDQTSASQRRLRK